MWIAAHIAITIWPHFHHLPLECTNVTNALFCSCLIVWLFHSEAPLCPGYCHSEHPRLQHLRKIFEEGGWQCWTSTILFVIAFQIPYSTSVFGHMVPHSCCTTVLISGLSAHVGSYERHHSGYWPGSPPPYLQGPPEDCWSYVPGNVVE